MLKLKLATLFLVSLSAVSFTAFAGGAERPNIVYIMSDELAYFELSHMGNSRVHTPRIDRMAKEGIRFTNALAGSPVCGPLRCNLLTGKHAGHASVRVNDGGTPLRADELTIASLLKARGYATGGFGKWGCGGRDSTGVPESHGFDVFFGYYDQVHAHSFYPPYLIRNSVEVELPGNRGGRSGKTYSHYEIVNEALRFIRDHKDEPFFCYLPITPPHGMYDIPQSDPAWRAYRDDAWMKDASIAQDVKNYAAMVTMVDNNVGQVLDLLEELNLDENTIVFFTGDNGGQDRFRSAEHPRGFFGPNVDPRTGVAFRGGKGNLYEGGLKIPFIARWPQRIAANQTSDLVFYQPDVLPTLAQLAGAEVPPDVDGLSIVAELNGKASEQKKHPHLYWEYGAQTAVRQGDWKGIQPRKGAAWQLYDLANDPSESNDLAERHPEIVKRLERIAAQEHEPVRPGTFTDPRRERHNRDRNAKWGSSRPPRKPASGRVHRIEAKNLIPADSMKLASFSSENKGNGKLAKNAIDGDPRTVWHTEFGARVAMPPHELVIDLGAVKTISGFRYLARQDSGWNGAFAKTEFAVGESPTEFGTPVATATFTKKRVAQVADCPQPVSGRYVRIRILSEVNKAPWASAAEIGIIASP